MLLSVARFELRYQLTSPAFWATFIIFFLMAFAAAASDNLSIGGKGGNVLVNAPFVIAQTTMIMSVFSLFVVAAFVANAVVRDDETRKKVEFFTRQLLDALAPNPLASHRLSVGSLCWCLCGGDVGVCQRATG